MKNYIYTGLVAVVVSLIAGYFLFSRTTVQNQTIASNVGDSYVTPISVSVQVDPTSATFGYDSATNKYIWGVLANSSGRDRFINSLEYGSIGLTTVSTSTTSAIGLTLATSSVATGLGGNTNYITNGPLVATSSTWYFQSGTSTPYGSVSSFVTGVSRVWPNGTNLVLEGSATSSASTWLKVNYLGQ